LLLGKLYCGELWGIREPYYEPKKALDYFNKIPKQAFWYKAAQKSCYHISLNSMDWESNSTIEERHSVLRNIPESDVTAHNGFFNRPAGTDEMEFEVSPPTGPQA